MMRLMRMSARFAMQCLMMRRKRTSEPGLVVMVIVDAGTTTSALVLRECQPNAPGSCVQAASER